MARTLRYLFVLLLVGVAGTALAQSGEITGKVIDEKKEPVIGAIVQVTSGGIARGGAVTDVDGNYVVSPLATGSNFEVKVSYTGYTPKIYKDVVVREGSTTKLNFALALNVNQLQEATVISYKVPLIEIGHPHGVLDAKDIKNTGITNTSDLVAVASPGIHISRSGGDLNAFGGRGNATQFILDGVIMNGATPDLPQGMIDQVDVLSSGLPAKYGDATGAVVNVTTRGPSKDFLGGLRLEHSIDGYNHNMASFNLSGPLYSRKDSMGNKKPVIGFLFGAEAWYDKDRSPYYGGSWVVNDDARTGVEQNPLTRSLNENGTVIYKYSGEYITKADMHKVKVRPNAAIFEGRANGKLDFQVADNMNLTAGGSFNYKNGSTFAENPGYRSYMPFASSAIPQDISTTGRGYLKFTQRFGKSGGTEKQSAIQNAYYSIQADYQVEHFQRQDPNFKKNIFEYEYVGKFDRQYAPGYLYTYDDSTKHYMYRLQGNRFPQQVLFERSDLNPLLANYTSEYYNLNGTIPADIVDIRANNAMLNGDMPANIYNTFANTGTSLSSYSYTNTNQFAVTADASFDLLLGKTRHSIQFGLYYQQRTGRGYAAYANPSGQGQSSLWQVMRSLQNNHITDLDLANPMYKINGNVYTWDQVKAGVIIPSVFDTVFFNKKAVLSQQSTFDKHLREKLGLDPNGVDYLNVDNVDPNTLSLDMFSPDELLNSGHPMVSYYGYDYTGKKQKENINFNDYFKPQADGSFTRNIGASRPSYTAAYLQDHFKYKDIDFNIGVRVDRFDANTKVLKDPYSLYEENTVGDVKNNTTQGGKNTNAKTPTGNIPANMGDNYVVYVDNNSSQRPNIIGFRNGDEWYDAQGNVLQDPSVLSVASGGLPPQPFLKDPNTKINDSSGFDASTSFTDYKPQVNVAPRISFSFPISTVANFYAHYDVIVQRPRGGRNFATPYDYYFLPQQANSIIDNNDLKPEKMFDYEVGFQQVLTKQSAITISGFYRERKDMIQVRPYLYAWPTTYYTYGNRDFSTTKGMTLSYDLRRFGNIRMKINYTLQFAEGTGSGDASGNAGNANTVGTNGLIQNLINAGVPNLRYVSDLDYDSRHLITANIDYRYDEGAGPVVGGMHILQNAGVNFNLSARSGEPYTKRLDANPSNRTVQGQINGSRLPWHYMMDMRIDKDFSLRSAKKQPAGETAVKRKKPLYLNGFIYFQNLFNIKDVITVYGYTGRPDDDGYLTSAQGIVAATTQTNAQAYKDVYSINIDNPYNYNLPRRMTIGLNLNF